MADYERLLISRVAQTSKVDKLLIEGIKEEHFNDIEAKELYKYLVKHFTRYKQGASFQTVRQNFPAFAFEVTDESLDFLKDQFMKQVKRRFAIAAVKDLASAIQDDSLVGDIDSLFLEKSRSLAQIVPSASVSRLSDLDKRLEVYSNPALAPQGIKMGIPEFDNSTLGIQPHEYVSVIGPSSLGKSTLAQYFLLNAYLQDKVPMFISLEMESSALLRKWDTMLIDEINYMDIKSCNLSAEKKKAALKKAKELRERKNDILIMDDVRNFTVDRVYAELVRWKPDIACIDYISLMGGGSANSQTWEKVTHLTQTLKQTARTLKIPIIGVAQTNRSSFMNGAALDNVSHSISVVQDSDLVIGLFQDDDMKNDQKMQVRLLKNRDGLQETADMIWDMPNMRFGPWRESYLFNKKHPVTA